MKIIGLDVGEKRIGVAKVDSNTRIALPIGFVEADGSEWQEIARLARLANTNLFVLGLPRSNEGNETKQTLYVRNFAKALTEKIPEAKIRFQDESLTSVEAEKRLKNSKKKYTKGDIDAEAATIILQDFIESFDGNTNKTDVKKTNDSKIALNAKKTSSKLKKWTIFGVPIILILILGGITAGLKIRDFIRQQREEEYRRQEAEMQASTFDFEIKPGETIFDIKSNLLRVNRDGGTEVEEPTPYYTAEEIDAAFNATYNYAFFNDRPAGVGLEGYLFPEKYNFYSSASVEDIIKTFLDGMNRVITENKLEEAYATNGLSLYEGIVLASVVQKEVPPQDMPTAAQVFLSRIDYGMTLGSDATVTYALNVVDPDRLVYQDNAAALEIDSCYNTRLYAGLPCGPVSNPGLSALTAVAHPTDTSYLFFLTGDDGVTYYSYTQAEHDENINLHCGELCGMSL
ncbi:endolytic transglycosylase MltG [Candidatus Saccharibacteria bacterium]|nr:endolytic transglycosylase MltG [Candidatus Saccharibacteria bacterium]